MRNAQDSLPALRRAVDKSLFKGGPSVYARERHFLNVIRIVGVKYNGKTDFDCHSCLRCQAGSSIREAWHFYGSYKFSTGVYRAFSWHFVNNYLSFQLLAKHALISRNVSQVWHSLAGQMPGHSVSRPIALLTEPLKLGCYRFAGSNRRRDRFGAWMAGSRAGMGKSQGCGQFGKAGSTGKTLPPTISGKNLATGKWVPIAEWEARP